MPSEALDIIVESSDDLIRIDKFIHQAYEDFTRTTVQKMIDEGCVLVNHLPTKANYVVKPGDLIEIEELPITLQDASPEDIALDIVFEDDDVLVVNKPSGMVVHPAPGNYTGTLVNALLFHINHLSKGSSELRPGIVHRIDKDTSGLLMIAKNDFSHQALSQELKDKKTKREYLALCQGVILNQKGTIHAPIGRSPQDRKKMAVVAEGKPATTHFEVLERYSDATLIKCILETGRTHQIRVHMAYIGYPLVGDYVYGEKVETDFGQYLHAKTLGFTHPRSKQWMEFDSDLPDQFKQKIIEFKNH